MLSAEPPPGVSCWQSGARLDELRARRWRRSRGGGGELWGWMWGPQRSSPTLRVVCYRAVGAQGDGWMNSCDFERIYAPVLFCF